MGSFALRPPVQAGFASQDLTSCIHDGTASRYSLEATCMALRAADGCFLLLSLDLIDLDVATCTDLRREVGATVGVNPDAILIHTTHTHTAPWNREGGSVVLPGLGALLVQCARRALDAARSALLRSGQTDVGSRLSMHRRGDAGGGLGVQTFWFGYRYAEGDDRPDASALANEMRTRWLAGKGEYVPGPEPVYFDQPADPLVQAMTFETPEGKTLGTVVRFAAHPHLTSACRERLYDPDFPGHLRRRMARETGGAPCVFLNGPCADLVPKEKVRYVLDEKGVPPLPYLGPTSAFFPESDAALLRETGRIGEELAEAALAGLRGAEARQVEGVRGATTLFGVPLDPALPATWEDLETVRRALAPEFEAWRGAGGSVAELRRLANRLNWLEWAATKSLHSLTEEDRRRGEKPMPVSVVEIGDLRMVFMPSEIALATTLALREKQDEGGADLWTVSLTNGSLEYFPTAEILDEGGYEGRSSSARRDGEEMLRRHVEEMVSTLAKVGK
jgi:hypothetical protein